MNTINSAIAHNDLRSYRIRCRRDKSAERDIPWSIWTSDTWVLNSVGGKYMVVVVPGGHKILRHRTLLDYEHNIFSRMLGSAKLCRYRVIESLEMSTVLYYRYTSTFSGSLFQGFRKIRKPNFSFHSYTSAQTHNQPRTMR